ncbi:MAG: PAS domain-containing protein [Nitrospirae bacterium]|nr:PAS domain-containing protein [Nitrospirota bacterium]
MPYEKTSNPDSGLVTNFGAQTFIARKHSALLFIALIVAGLAGNYFRFEIIFNIQFIFGSIFSILALQFFGYRWGVLSALAISSSTYLLWNHPYAIVIMTLEVAVVGMLIKRRNISILLADTIYWVFIGIPLVIIFYYGVMHLPFYTASVTMMKQALNGISNALLARLIFMISLKNKDSVAFPLRELIFSLLALFVLVPSLLILSIQSHSDLARTDTSVRKALKLAVQKTVPSVENWLKSHLDIVEHMAWMSVKQSLPMIQSALDQRRISDSDFLRIGLLDKSATITAYSPLIDELGQTNIGKNFADRPFIPILKEKLKPMLSEVVMGRIGNPKPMVTALAPVVKNGNYAGYVTGILNLDSVQSMIELNIKSESLPDIHFILLDKNRRVIASNCPEFKILQHYQQPEGEAINHGDGIFSWIPYNMKNVSISDRWKKAFYITESSIGSMSEWSLIVEQPMAPFQKQLYEQYAVWFSWIFAIFLISIAIAELTSRRFMKSLEDVRAISTDIPTKIYSGEVITWPESNIQETKALIENYKKMSHAITKQFNTVKDLNIELEHRVDERTQELREKTALLENVINSSNDYIFVKDRDLRTILCNKAFANALGKTPEDLYGKTDIENGWSADLVLGRPEEGIRGYQDDDLATLSGETLNINEVANVGNELRAFNTIKVPLRSTDNNIIGLLAIARDITDKKKAEEQIERSLKEKETLLREIHHRVKNNMQVIYSLLNLQAKGVSEPEVRAKFEECRNRIASMSLIHEKLYGAADLAHVDFKEYLKSLIDGIASTYKRHEVYLSVDMEPVALDVNTGIPCGLIANELVSNSLKYAFPEGRKGIISVGININSEGKYVLFVKDNGIGFPADIDFRNTATLGLDLVNGLTAQLHGTIELSREGGTKFSITFSPPPITE